MSGACVTISPLTPTMTNFTKKQQAEAKRNVGRGKIDVGRSKGRGAIGNLSNQEKLAITRSGVKDLMEGTMELNRLKKNQSTDGNN